VGAVVARVVARVRQVVLEGRADQQTGGVRPVVYLGRQAQQAVVRFGLLRRGRVEGPGRRLRRHASLSFRRRRNTEVERIPASIGCWCMMCIAM
jgi:hypothetical protein